MKKCIKFLIIVIVCYFVITTVNKIFLKKYNIKYEIDKYNINEVYIKYKKTDNYEINIKNKEVNITYEIEENFKKKKKIIKEINEYKKDNIICIVPIYKKDIEHNIYCQENKQQVSTEYLKNNKSFQEIIKKAHKMKINNILNDRTEKKVKYKKIKYFKDNIKSNEIYTIWDYKGIYILKENKVKYIKILDYDLYDNVKSIMFDKYFILFENNDVNGIKNIHVYDLVKDKMKIYNPEIIIDKDFYINGVYDNKIYVTDNKKKNQYVIDIKKEKIEQINKSNEYQIIYNNKIKKITKSDYFMQENYINKKIKNNKIVTGNKSFYKDNNQIYRKVEDRNSVLLFDKENIKEWNIKDDKILLIIDNKLYSYDDNNGLVIIAENNELRYNYNNICNYLKIED